MSDYYDGQAAGYVFGREPPHALKCPRCRGLEQFDRLRVYRSSGERGETV